MITATEMLKKIHPGLVSRNKDINGDIEDFHNQVLHSLKNYEKAQEEAGRVSEDLKPGIRQDKQREIIAKAFETLMSEVDKAAQPYRSRTGSARQEIETASRPPVQKTEMAELIALLKAQEIRRQLEGMAPEDRSALLRSTVGVGDPSILHAVEGSLISLIPSPLVDMARQRYQETALSDKLQALEFAEIFSDSVSTTQRFVPSAAMEIAKGAGLGVVFDTMKNRVNHEWISKTDTDKAAFIADNGLEAFKNLVG